jgi:TRAP-type C4-dicarboxylate transport system substrate-binding protein
MSAWSGALALGVAFGLAIGSAASADAQIKWNMPGAYAADNYHSENLVFFAKEVANETGGKLQITVHPGASLFKAPEIKRAVATGQAQLGEVLISIHENEEPVYGIDTIPFLATSFADAKKLNEARKATMVARLDSQGLTLLFAVPWGPQGLYSPSRSRPLRTSRGSRCAPITSAPRASPSWRGLRASPFNWPSWRRRWRPGRSTPS